MPSAATDRAVLAALLLGSGTAPEIAGLFSGELLPVYHLQKTQVYRALERLAAQGLVAAEGHRPSPSGPPALRYALTPKGRAQAEAWLEAPALHPLEARVQLRLKLAFLHLLGRDPRPLLRSQEKAYQGLLAGLQEGLAGAQGLARLNLLWRREMVQAGLRFVRALLQEAG